MNRRKTHSLVFKECKPYHTDVGKRVWAEILFFAVRLADYTLRGVFPTNASEKDICLRCTSKGALANRPPRARGSGTVVNRVATAACQKSNKPT